MPRQTLRIAVIGQVAGRSLELRCLHFGLGWGGVGLGCGWGGVRSGWG